MISHHITSETQYLKIFGILIGLTVITAASDYVNLGPFNLIVAMIIAGTKAALVAIYFMHLRSSGKLTWAFCGLAILFLAILIAMTCDDVFTRNWIPRPDGWLPFPRGE